MSNDEQSADHEFALEVYRALRQEVLGRIHEHHNLWVWKLASVGAVLSFALAENVSASAYVVAIAPLISLAFDALIANNLVVMKSLGGYISTNIEPRYRFNEVGGWETASVKTRHFGARKRLWINDWIVINASSACVWGSSILLFGVDGSLPLGPAVMLFGSGLILIFHSKLTWDKLCRRPADVDVDAIASPER